MSDVVPRAGLPFLKMHGLGNDFVVIDTRVTPVSVSPALARALADRHRGVGFDQMALIEPDEEADLRLSFLNADGSAAGACGNATRCIARHEMAATGRAALKIRTERGVLEARDAGQGMTSVNMGHPLTGWAEIPLSHEVDTLHLPLEGDPVATSMGNPHCTFFVEDLTSVDLATRGPAVETDPLFPDRTNVQFAYISSTTHIQARVWERGAGVTLASGSSSCAVAVAARRRGLTERAVRVTLDGGDIEIDWRETGVWMTGPTAHVFSGVLSAEFLGSVE